MDNDRADHELLQLANEKGKFGVAVDYSWPAHQQFAFERGIDEGWFVLVDVTSVASMPGHLLRLFRLTTEGRVRKLILENQYRAKVVPFRKG